MNKKSVLEYMTNRWFAEKIYNDIVFYKHINVNKRASIYQVVLSGTMYDGVYELNVGEKFEWTLDEMENLTIQSLHSLESATFKKGKSFPKGYKASASCSKKEFSIVRLDYDTEENFMKALLDTGYVTEEEYYTYTYRDSHEYIYGKVPKIGFAA